jgi:hypothetical protein
MRGWMAAAAVVVAVVAAAAGDDQQQQQHCCDSDLTVICAYVSVYNTRSHRLARMSPLCSLRGLSMRIRITLSI